MDQRIKFPHARIRKRSKPGASLRKNSAHRKRVHTYLTIFQATLQKRPQRWINDGQGQCYQVCIPPVLYYSCQNLKKGGYMAQGHNVLWQPQSEAWALYA